jgi:hypothetical protein
MGPLGADAAIFSEGVDGIPNWSKLGRWEAGFKETGAEGLGMGGLIGVDVGVMGGLVGMGVGFNLGASILGPAPPPKSPRGSSSKPFPLKFRGDPPIGAGGGAPPAGPEFIEGAAFIFRQSWQTGFPVSISRQSSQ